MPRVALVAPAFPSYAGEPFVPYWADFVAELSRHADVTVFPLRLPAGDRPFALHGARVVPLPHGHVRLRHSPGLWSAAVRRIVGAHRADRADDRGGFDVVHALRGNEAGFVGALAARAIGAPLAVHLLGGELVGLSEIGYGSQLYPWERAHVAVSLRRAALVTVSTRGMAALARAGMGSRRAGRVRWAPLGIDTEVFRPAPFPERPRLLHVAELNPVKDQATLLGALARVAETHPEVRLDLVGGGPRLADLRRLAHNLGVARRIQWWGQIPRPAVLLAAARAGAFVLSSRHEGQGMVLAEAAACGLPIAATRVGMAPDLPGEGVRMAPPGDVEGLAQAMRWALGLAADPAARERARLALRQAAVHDYDVRVCVARWLAMYAQVLRVTGRRQ